MPRVQTKTKNRAGRDIKCGRCGAEIKPGERYHKWSFYRAGNRFACAEHYPRPSELTQSLMGGVYAAQESAQDQMAGTEDTDDIKALVDEVAAAAEEVAEQYRDASEPFGGQGEHAERADELDGWVQELQGFYPDDDADLEDVRAEADELIGGCPL